ncbi:hypothetical protein [Ralstonia syzygii]|uniref:hypothetical protein n=1 Tax=Ralstonia syzygii TaxID=28097 RepID=UPI0018D048B7|nr:hypothetical protein [Ralstonia syzygii]
MKNLRRILREYRTGKRGMPTYAELAEIAYGAPAMTDADEREAFKAWHLVAFKEAAPEYPPDDVASKYFQDPVWMAWEARAAQADTPDGYALVPVEPTTDMLHQMASDYLDQHGYGDSFIKSMYKAALDAATTPGTVKHG